MQGEVRPIDEADLPRVVQLLAKTNQFNLTTRRHTRQAILDLLAVPGSIGLTLRLRDRFGDHGLVAVLIAVPADGPAATLRIDTWLMSCRVIGRTVEAAMLAQACAQPGVRRLRGTYVATDRNGLVRDLYPRLGFTPAGDGWEYDVAALGPINSPFIRVGPPDDDRG
jgi:FkbH-like protein